VSDLPRRTFIHCATNSRRPFYKRSENFVEPLDPAKQQHHHEIYYTRDAMGVDGPLRITYLPEYSESHAHWHKTLNQLGLETNKSHLSGSNVGVWTNVVAVDPRTTTRSYSTPAYYLPNANRPNLRVLTNATVREIVLEQSGEQWTATGVRFDHGDQSYTAAASHEIVLSAGSVASPQLLELSGIGNPSVLERAGITVKIPNQNVGENVQEHMSKPERHQMGNASHADDQSVTATVYEIDTSIKTPEDLRSDATLAAEADKLYETTQSGPRAVLPCSISYVPFSHFTPLEILADIAKRAPRSSLRERILAERLSSPEPRLGQAEYIFDVGNWSPFLKASDPARKYATLLQILQYPFSCGSVHISHSDPHGRPEIDPQYYTGNNGVGALDLELQVSCARFGQKLVQTEPLASFIKGPAWPASSELGDEGLKQWVVDNTITDWHPVGSCAMGGSLGMEGGVVDERLRVYGVCGLRVVDASVMPLQISAHLQATIYAIAEKASEMIKEDHLEYVRRAEDKQR
jgi:choline dehydrogenase-like flavoprotein